MSYEEKVNPMTVSSPIVPRDSLEEVEDSNESRLLTMITSCSSLVSSLPDHHSHHSHHQRSQHHFATHPHLALSHIQHHRRSGPSSVATCDQLTIPMDCDSRQNILSPSASASIQQSSSLLTNSSQILYPRISENGSTSLTIGTMDTDDRPRAFLRIIEQPTNRIRYRYKSEKGSHGGLTGANSSQNKKTYPAVKLENYHSTSQVYIKASLYINESTPRLHVHKLMGKNCDENGYCIIPIGENNQAVFQNIGILFVGKKEVPEILYQRKLEEHKLICALSSGAPQLTDAEKERLREESDREAKRINLNSVKICFQAFDQSQEVNFPICDAVFSRPIANQKSPDSGELKIVRMDRYSGLTTGNEEVFLLCEKVNKKEIKIRFFETDMEGNQTWEAFASFTEADVHHQVAIVFRTPPYHDLSITHSVQVYVQLYRPKDGEYSEPRPFTYRPRLGEDVDRKRKKVPEYSSNSDVNQYQGYNNNDQYLVSPSSIEGQCQAGAPSESERINFFGSN